MLVIQLYKFILREIGTIIHNKESKFIIYRIVHNEFMLCKDENKLQHAYSLLTVLCKWNKEKKQIQHQNNYETWPW